LIPNHFSTAGTHRKHKKRKRKTRRKGKRKRKRREETHTQHGDTLKLSTHSFHVLPNVCVGNPVRYSVFRGSTILIPIFWGPLSEPSKTHPSSLPAATVGQIVFLSFMFFFSCFSSLLSSPAVELKEQLL